MVNNYIIIYSWDLLRMKENSIDNNDYYKQKLLILLKRNAILAFSKDNSILTLILLVTQKSL